MSAIDAVVLAGGPRDDVCATNPDIPNKAFLPIRGKTLVERTIQALRTSRHVGRIVVVAPPQAATCEALVEANEIRAAGTTMTQSLGAGIAGFAPDRLVLITASDLPILSSGAVDDTIARAVAASADIAYTCVERATHEAAYPHVPHTWAKLADGTYCGGGVVALRPRVLPKLERLLGKLGNARKNPLALAAIFGPAIVVRYAAGRLTIADAERRASELTGAPVAAIVSPFAEIAVNVDRASDVAIAESLIDGR